MKGDGLIWSFVCLKTAKANAVLNKTFPILIIPSMFHSYDPWIRALLLSLHQTFGEARGPEFLHRWVEDQPNRVGRPLFSRCSYHRRSARRQTAGSGLPGERRPKAQTRQRLGDDTPLSARGVVASLPLGPVEGEQGENHSISLVLSSLSLSCRIVILSLSLSWSLSLAHNLSLFLSLFLSSHSLSLLSSLSRHLVILSISLSLSWSLPCSLSLTLSPLPSLSLFFVISFSLSFVISLSHSLTPGAYLGLPNVLGDAILLSLRVSVCIMLPLMSFLISGCTCADQYVKPFFDQDTGGSIDQGVAR